MIESDYSDYSHYSLDLQCDETAQLGSREMGDPELSLIIPIEAGDNRIGTLLDTLKRACAGITVEVIVIDGGVDQRSHMEREAREAESFVVRILHWPETQSLEHHAAAIRMGMDVAKAPYIGVVTPDFPYPPEQLLHLYHIAHVHGADVVIGSRYRPGAQPKREPYRLHALGPWVLRQAIRAVFPERLLRVCDPLSSLFLVHRSLLVGHQIRLEGYAPSLECLVRTPWTRLIEVPYTYEQRPASTESATMIEMKPLLRQVMRLILTVPGAAAVWKTSLVWLLGCLPALALLGGLQYFGLPLWLTWVAAIEAQLVCVASVSSLNVDHHAGPKAILLRWLLSHWTFALPIALDGALTLALSHPLQSSLASFVVASVAGLVASRLLDTREDPFQVFYAKPMRSFDETVQMAQIDQGGRTLSTLMVMAALAVGVVSVAIGQLGPLVIIPTVIIGGAFLLQYQIDRTRAVTVALAAASGVAAIDYTFWRIQMTNMSAWYIAVPLLFAELFGMAHMLGLQWSLWPRERQRIRREEDPTKRPIFILIPTVDEGRQILEETVRACLATRDSYLRRYPQGRVEIVICNDGLAAKAPNWREPIQLAKRLGVTCVTREVGGGAKAGNIEYARRAVGAVGDALIVVFDADQVAYRNFLVEIVAPFTDSSIGWVQSGQYYRNLDNPVARWADDQQSLFYQLLCPGKETLNAVFMCGTNLMIRAAALDEIGGFPQDSITEDFAASVLLHGRWRSVFLPQMLATGLGPFDLAAYFKQQERWAIGTFSVLREEWRRIFLPGWGDLSFQQRLQYALGCTYYFSGVRDLIYIMAPLAYVYFGVSAVNNGSMSLYLWHFLPYWVLSMSAFAYAAWNRTGWRGVVIGFASFPILVAATITVLTGRRTGFTVTRKQRMTGGSHYFVILPHLIVWAASVFALIRNWRDGAFTHGPGFFVEVWLTYICAMLTFSLWLVAHDEVYHITQRLMARLHPHMRIAIAWMSWRVRPEFVMTSAVFCGLLWGSFAYTPVGVFLQRYEVTRQTPSSAQHVSATTLFETTPYLGITGQTQQVDRDAPALQSQLGIPATVVGRTVNVADSFDQRWADALSAEGAYPLLTLQFGRFQPNGRPSLDASLPAIANGSHDAKLTRLAQEIRAYGKPVLITVLPYVDRNWSLNSAVANGSIPSDTPRAWAHIQSVFRAAGATNVAWVWSPADPAHDLRYAPPADSIGFVTVTLTYTSSTVADDPALISQAEANHPGKPLLVEIATAQRDAGEERWLRQIAAQVDVAGSHVAALIYFDGLPGESQYQASFALDANALYSMREMVDHAPRAPQTQRRVR